MSFILDALRKSEQKRRRGSVPDLLTVHEPMPKEPGKRSLWRYLIFLLMLNAVVFAVWLRPLEQERQDIVTQQPARQGLESGAIKAGQEGGGLSEPVLPPSAETGESINAEARTAGEESLPLSAPGVISLPVNNVPQKKPVQAEAELQKTVPVGQVPVFDRGEDIKISLIEQEQASLAVPSPGELQPSSRSEPETEKEVFNLNELPVSIQQSLPDLTISGHIYSNRAVAQTDFRFPDQLITRQYDLTSIPIL